MLAARWHIGAFRRHSAAWHESLATIVNAVDDGWRDNHEWSAWFNPIRASNGVIIRPLCSTSELQEEGRGCITAQGDIIENARPDARSYSHCARRAAGGFRHCSFTRGTRAAGSMSLRKSNTALPVMRRRQTWPSRRHWNCNSRSTKAGSNLALALRRPAALGKARDCSAVSTTKAKRPGNKPGPALFHSCRQTCSALARWNLEQESLISASGRDASNPGLTNPSMTMKILKHGSCVGFANEECFHTIRAGFK